MAMLNNQRVHRMFEAQLKSATRDFSVTIEKKQKTTQASSFEIAKL